MVVGGGDNGSCCSCGYGAMVGVVEEVVGYLL